MKNQQKKLITREEKAQHINIKTSTQQKRQNKPI